MRTEKWCAARGSPTTSHLRKFIPVCGFANMLIQPPGTSKLYLRRRVRRLQRLGQKTLISIIRGFLISGRARTARYKFGTFGTTSLQPAILKLTARTMSLGHTDWVYTSCVLDWPCLSWRLWTVLELLFVGPRIACIHPDSCCRCNQAEPLTAANETWTFYNAL